MIIGKVVGNTWATQRHDSLKPYRMLLVKHYDPTTEETSGIPYMALDNGIDAGIGETVLMLDDGGSARIMLEDDMAPVRCMIVGVVDDIRIAEEYANQTA